MDLGKLLQALGGRVLRRLVGVALKEGINRMGGTSKGKPATGADRARTAQAQKRLRDALRIGRRFWR